MKCLLLPCCCCGNAATITVKYVCTQIFIVRLSSWQSLPSSACCCVAEQPFEFKQRHTYIHTYTYKYIGIKLAENHSYLDVHLQVNSCHKISLQRKVEAFKSSSPHMSKFPAYLWTLQDSGVSILNFNLNFGAVTAAQPGTRTRNQEFLTTYSSCQLTTYMYIHMYVYSWYIFTSPNIYTNPSSKFALPSTAAGK